MSRERGRPPGFALAISRLICFHSLSVRSLGYLFLFITQAYLTGGYFLDTLYNGELHNYWAWDHMHNAPMGRPLLVLDMYEHAYHIDYGTAAAKYIDAFMLNVNCEEVSRRAEAAIKISVVTQAR